MNLHRSPDALEARFAHRVAARLTEQSSNVSADISERLRFAREQALERAHAARPATAAQPVVLGRGSAALGGRGGWGWWNRLALALPLVALVGGLVLIQNAHDDEQIAAAAEVDAALLSDDVPPAAYADAGFVEFLKTPRE